MAGRIRLIALVQWQASKLIKLIVMGAALTPAFAEAGVDTMLAIPT
jgi:hypothetical protein